MAATGPAAIGAVNAAAVTPRRAGSPEIDMAAAFELIDFLCGAGIEGIALMGSTGEFTHFNLEERTRLIELAVKRSRVPVIAAVSHSTLEGAVLLGREAAYAGAAALLLMPPYFFRYSQEQVREFYLRFAAEIRGAAPVLLYNVPLFTSEISCDTAIELLSTGLFAGIKDSSGRWDAFARLRALRDGKPFTLLVGNDVLFKPGRMFGADGVVSGVASALPELMLALDRAIRCGAAEARERLDARLHEFIGWIDRFPVPVGIREASAVRGLKVGPHAVPLSPSQHGVLNEFRQWFKGWLPAVLEECKSV